MKTNDEHKEAKQMATFEESRDRLVSSCRRLAQQARAAGDHQRAARLEAQADRAAHEQSAKVGRPLSEPNTMRPMASC